ncbi:TonB-dependent siderophore receptor [Achromobacter seleniivolatilans]|uniref:TonB-dependent siderophore receptor n=1 Tax=Achromobacter seleniivolatilans TaxID=3047478 RepID=A0ABY9M2S2_9BURK|nr:TonB-dependent siderophore receptor [Achromobacter sp. R39]WMD20869.1 TonB-dependent siderophore receptor [Achromobacter sp. R39]
MPILFATALLAGAGAGTYSSNARAQSAPATRSYDIPAGSLGAVLSRFAAAADITLSFDAEQTRGRESTGLRGAFTVEGGLAQLLTGSGLQAVHRGSGNYVLRTAPAAGVTTLPVVTVTGNRETAFSPMEGYVATRSATATKTDTPILETPQSVSVVGREEMEARGALNIMDIVQYTPGVTVNTYGPDNRGWDDISLRGFNTFNSGYRDGLAQTPAGITYYFTEPYGLDRVEVLRGPSSMTFGQGDAGGIINNVSKKPTGERIREVELQYGSFDRKQAAFDLGDAFGVNDTLSYRLVGLGLDSNDQDEYPNGQKLNHKRVYVAPSLRWQPNAATSFTLLGEYINIKSGEDPYFFSTDYKLTDVKMGDPGFSRIKREQSSIGYQFEHRFNDDWTFRQNFRYTHLSVDRRVVWTDSINEDVTAISRVARTWNDPMSQSVLDTQMQGKLRFAGTEHTVLLGVDWSDQRAKANRYIGPAPDLDLLNPIYNVPIETPTEPLANYGQKIRQAGIYLQDQIKLGDRWIVTLGGRQDRVTSILDDHLNDSYRRNTDDAFSGRAGVTYLAGNGVAPYVSYSESFLPNSGVDSNNNPFKPSRGKQVEVGVKYQPTGSRSLYTMALFDLNKTNIVSYNPVEGEQRQIGKQRARGLELEAKGELMRGLNIAASYTWLDLRVKNSGDVDEINKVPVGVPKQTAALWLDYTLAQGLGVGGGVRYIGKRWDDEHNSTARPGVTLADATVHYETGPWRLALNVSNLFNKEYYSICYSGECYRGAERTVVMTARYRW